MPGIQLFCPLNLRETQELNQYSEVWDWFYNHGAVSLYKGAAVISTEVDYLCLSHLSTCLWATHACSTNPAVSCFLQCIMHGDCYQFVSSWSSLSRILPNLFWLYSVFISAPFCIACSTHHAPDNNHSWSNLGSFLNKDSINILQQAFFPPLACVPNSSPLLWSETGCTADLLPRDSPREEILQWFHELM